MLSCRMKACGNNYYTIFAPLSITNLSLLIFNNLKINYIFCIDSI